MAGYNLRLPVHSIQSFAKAHHDESNFQHILRVLNTNLDGKVKAMFALTSIKGVGRRFSNICCKKAEVELGKR